MIKQLINVVLQFLQMCRNMTQRDGDRDTERDRDRETKTETERKTD